MHCSAPLTQSCSLPSRLPCPSPSRPLAHSPMHLRAWTACTYKCPPFWTLSSQALGLGKGSSSSSSSSSSTSRTLRRTPCPPLTATSVPCFPLPGRYSASPTCLAAAGAAQPQRQRLRQGPCLASFPGVAGALPLLPQSTPAASAVALLTGAATSVARTSAAGASSTCTQAARGWSTCGRPMRAPRTCPRASQ